MWNPPKQYGMYVYLVGFFLIYNFLRNDFQVLATRVPCNTERVPVLKFEKFINSITGHLMGCITHLPRSHCQKACQTGTRL